MHLGYGGVVVAIKLEDTLVVLICVACGLSVSVHYLRLGGVILAVCVLVSHVRVVGAQRQPVYDSEVSLTRYLHSFVDVLLRVLIDH